MRKRVAKVRFMKKEEGKTEIFATAQETHAHEGTVLPLRQPALSFRTVQKIGGSESLGSISGCKKGSSGWMKMGFTRQVPIGDPATQIIPHPKRKP